MLLDAKRGSHGRDFCDRVTCAGIKGSLAQQEDPDQKLLRGAESKIDRPADMLAEGAEVGLWHSAFPRCQALAVRCTARTSGTDARPEALDGTRLMSAVKPPAVVVGRQPSAGQHRGCIDMRVSLLDCVRCDGYIDETLTCTVSTVAMQEHELDHVDRWKHATPTMVGRHVGGARYWGEARHGGVRRRHRELEYMLEVADRVDICAAVGPVRIARIAEVRRPERGIQSAHCFTGLLPCLECLLVSPTTHCHEALVPRASHALCYQFGRSRPDQTL